MSCFKICDDYGEHVCKEHHPNYLHELRDETALLLEMGGLWKYSNDAQETLQALCKKVWMHCWAQKRKHPVEVIMERHFMKTHLCVSENGPHKIFMLESEKRKIAEVMESLKSTTYKW
jgi:hypothetical protein